MVPFAYSFPAKENKKTQAALKFKTACLYFLQIV